jgi:uncharacterized membrane protein YkoI
VTAATLTQLSGSLQPVASAPFDPKAESNQEDRHMTETPKKAAVAVAASVGVALGAFGIADAASTAKHTTKRHATSSASTDTARGPKNEPALTGDTLKSASDAALAAVPGGTVERASKEDPSDASGAAYEVHVTKSDGSEVEVLLDSSFKVIKTQASQQHGGRR